jgi:hypothetical protein
MWARFNEVSFSILGGTVQKADIKSNSCRRQFLCLVLLILWQKQFIFHKSMLIQIVGKLKLNFVWDITPVLKGTLSWKWSENSGLTLLCVPVERWPLFFLVKFVKLLKTTITFVMSVCPYVRASALKNSAPAGRIKKKKYLRIFKKIFRDNLRLIKILLQ